MIPIEHIEVGGLYKKCNKVLRVLSIFDAYSSAYGKNILHVEVEWAAGKRIGQPSKIWWLGQLAAWADSIVHKPKRPRKGEKVVNCLRCSRKFNSECGRNGIAVQRICPECTAYNEQVFSGSLL